MKIEKISETQIKVFLSRADLLERNIKLTELAYGSEKTQALFREMMEEAIDMCDFDIENSPLMIEAVPVSADSIMIIVSKVPEESHIDNGKFNLVPPSREERKFKRNQIKRDYCGYEDEYLENGDILIYSFDNLDTVSSLARRVCEVYSGTNSLYRYDGRYFLVLWNDNPEDELENDFLEMILSEYGMKHISNEISESYLQEHGEIVVRDEVVRKFSEYL